MVEKKKKIVEEDPIEVIKKETVKEVIDQLLPKLEAMEARIKEETRTELQDIRSKMTVVEAKPQQQIDLKTMFDTAMKDPELKKMLGGLQGGDLIGMLKGGNNMPQDPNMGGQQPMGGLGQLFEIFRFFKSMDAPAGGGGSLLSPDMMQQMLMRSYISDMVSSKQRDIAITKHFMQTVGIDPTSIQGYEKTQSALLDPVFKLGENEEKKKIEQQRSQTTS